MGATVLYVAGPTDVDIEVDADEGDVELVITQVQGESPEVTDGDYTVSLATTGGGIIIYAIHIICSYGGIRYAIMEAFVYIVSMALPVHHSVLISGRDTGWYSGGGRIPEAL